MTTHESALLVACPAAEPAVRRWRERYDLAARDGIPAHVTVLYPLPARVTAEQHEHLSDALSRHRPFDLVGSGVAWFGDAVTYVAPADPTPLVTLTSSVAAVFPDHPPYGGAHETVVPHLTIGHDQPVTALVAAADDVAQRLPFVQHVTHVELWSGPVVTTRRGPAPWRRVRAYALGA